MKTTSSKVLTTILANRLSEIQNDWKTPWIKGNEIEAFWTGNADDLRDAIDAAIEKGTWFCSIRIKDGDDSYYSISKDEIVVPQKDFYKIDDDFYAEVLHNMAHSTGAENNLLGRFKPSTFGSVEYVREELVAELTAAYACARFGIEKKVKSDSLAYIKKWIEDVQEDEDFVDNVLYDVLDASKMILVYIQQYERNYE